MRIQKLTISLLLCAALSIIASAGAFADDIDIYKTQFSGQSKPNILFLLDYSGSMLEDVYGNSTSQSGLPAKIDILKQSLVQVLDQNQDRINAGIGSIFSSQPSGVRWPVSELSGDANTIDPDIPAGSFTVKDILAKEINRRYAGGSTATVGALVEAALYLRGGPVLHNSRDPNRPRQHRPDSWDVLSERYASGSVTASMKHSYLPQDAYASNVNEPGNYWYCYDKTTSGGSNSCSAQAVYECQNIAGSSGTNADGQAYSYSDYVRCKVPDADAWHGAQYVSPITQSCQENAVVLISDGKPSVYSDNAALQTVVGSNHASCEDLSSSIFEAGPGGEKMGNCGPEIVRDLASNDQIAGVPGSTVKTYTVGFDVEGPGKRYLELLAEEGGGRFFEVNQADELSTALLSAIDDVAATNEVFSPFSIDINKATFSHDNRLFLTMFKPENRQGWSGNLKGYFIGADGITDTQGKPATELKSGAVQFSESSQSFWSSSADGNDVLRGGASEKLQNQSVRSLYTFPYTTAPAGANLASSPIYQLRATNSEIDETKMGLAAGSALRAASLDWLLTAPMGDPLHTVSTRVQYAGRTVVYAMTNQGLLHAIDATSPTDMLAMDHSGGDELFAFMPGRLLPNLPKLYAQNSGGDHIYGLDGGLTQWHTDSNGDGIVNNAENVLLFFGMRRGGEAYYAMDVSDPLQPKLMWTIDKQTPGFENLAQTWSRASLVTVNDNGVPARMLVFGGGYDAAELDGLQAPKAAKGNAIYMVDEQGTLRWSVQQTDNIDFQYAIASDITIIDSDNDGQSDRLYVGDLGGQVWRVDYDNINDSPTVKLFADFSSDGYQPFFYAPSVALNKHAGEEFISVTLGSGNRTDPLNDSSKNGLFMLRDTDVAVGATVSGTPTIRKKDLFNVNDNDIGSSDESVAETAREKLSLSRGWVMDFATGEKSLAKIVTFEDTILATTYQATEVANDPCASSSTARLYTLNLKTAEPIKFLDDGSESDIQLSVDDRFVKLENGGIPSSPKIVFRADSSVAEIYVDRQKVSVIDGRLRVVYWHAR